MPRFDLVTIGEGQLRFSIPIGTRLENVDRFDVHACGTEANVAGLLSRLGWRCGWFSGLPKTPLGKRVVNQFKASGMDLSAVVWSDVGRLATYYVEYSTPPRQTQVYYDRADTCFARLTDRHINWDYLSDAQILHLSGLTVPLSPHLREIIPEAIRRANAKGVLVSFDVNYRSRIWPSEEARAALLPIFANVDILFCSRTDATLVFGIEGEPESILEQLGQITQAKHIVTSLSHDGLIGWDRCSFYRQTACDVEILDRIGAGDAMVAGVLHGMLLGDFAKGLRYGAFTAALALTQYGDQVVTTRAELDDLVNSQGGRDICR